jgi:hypothetical protein
MRNRGVLAALVLAVFAVLVLIGSMVAGMAGAGGEPPVAEEQEMLRLEGRVRVEVLNASGIPGLARRGTEHLRARGFDVVYYGNASGFGGDSSLVLDRVGRPEEAERVAREMGVREVRSVPDTTLYLDVTVVLGRDWEP